MRNVRDPYSYREEETEPTRPLFKRLAFWLIVVSLAVVIAIFTFFVGFMFDAWNPMVRGFINGIWYSWLFPNGWNVFMATPFVIVSAALIALGFTWLFAPQDEARPRWLKLVTVVVVIGCVAWVFQGFWYMNERGARHYLSTTTLVVQDKQNVPGMLTKLAASNEAMVGISQGDLPSEWTPRAASATGAERVLRRTGDAISNTELMSDTLTYLYGAGNSGAWSAIRNGKNQQPIYGVASWDGTGENVETCEFAGENELNKAFGGMWGKNLSDNVAAKNLNFTFDQLDMWGYCDDGKPVIVIPGTKTVGYSTRTVDQSYGVMTITGSPSGEPVITHLEEVEPGDFPGPVYASRLVNNQLDSLKWAAGRHLRMFESFGFEATDVSSQSGNNGNYLLKNVEDGRLYWVTPLKPLSTDSQTLIAYSVTPADQVKANEMNEQKVYVLGNDDPRIVNLDNLEAVVTDEVRTTDPGFFTGETPGRIVEFLPVADDKWQVFAEVNGRVKYRIDVSIGARITTQVVRVDEESAEETPVTPPSSGGELMSCDNPASLDDAKLAACLSGLANELQRRQTEPTK